MRDVSIWNLYNHLFFGKILRFLTCLKCVPGIIVGGIIPIVIIWMLAPYSGNFSISVLFIGLILYGLELILCALFSLVEVCAKLVVGWLFVDI